MSLLRPASRLVALALIAGCTAPEHALRVDPASLEFGAVPVGGAEEAHLGIRNASDEVLSVQAVTLAEGDPAAWEIATDLADLFPGARGSVTVRFTPYAVGRARGRLEIHTDDPGGSPLGVSLRGTGEDPGNPSDDGDTATPDGTGPDGTGPGGGAPCGDADGDGHDACDPGGDCDDTDPSAWPLLVDAGATGAADGTAAAPYPTLEAALPHLDATCREVVLRGGTHAVAIRWDSGALTVRGAADEAAVITPPAGAAAFVVGPEGRLRLDALTLSGARPGARDEPYRDYDYDDDDDHASCGGPDGGALRVEGGAATLVRVVVSDNQCAGNGGAVALAGGELTLERCTFADNVAGGGGGAVYAHDGAVRDTASAWTGNHADHGGAIAVDEGVLTIDGASFAGNRADGSGGAIHARDVDTITLERVVAEGDVAGGRGGALYVDDAADGLVRNVVVQGARAGDDGGGVAVDGCSALALVNNTIVDTAAGGDGGAVWLGGEPECTTWAWSNVLAYAGGASGLHVTEGAGASVAYTLGWGADGDEMVLPSAADDGGNLVGDPLFVAFSDDGVANDDLTPGPGSPALDAGPPDGEGPAGYTDWADPDGTRNDRGATGGPGAG